MLPENLEVQDMSSKLTFDCEMLIIRKGRHYVQILKGAKITEGKAYKVRKERQNGKQTEVGNPGQ